VGREDDVGRAAEWVVRWQRLGREDIEHRTLHMSRVECGNEGLIVDDSATREVRHV
jgi:hypothetical protein